MNGLNAKAEAERVHHRNDRPTRNGQYVLYWMQASQRASWNPALEHAIALGDQLGVPVVACFGLTPDYPEANLRSYAFLLGGLEETVRALAERGLQCVTRVGDPPQVALDLARDAAAVVTDCGYLRHQRLWRETVAKGAPCPVVEVESDLVVPVELAYPRQAWSAAVLRRRIQPLMPTFLHPLRDRAPRHSSLQLEVRGEDSRDLSALLAALPIDRSVSPVALVPGTEAARARLARFIEDDLSLYAEARGDPAAQVTSGLSPYLHFGQISPVEVAWRVSQVGGAGPEAFLEELVVRRELAINLTVHNPQYDTHSGLPPWARETLALHAADPRPAVYTADQLELGQTDDPAWNAAQTELQRTGTIHGYMRMYWGKQIVAWVPDPERAFDMALHLNNTYGLDGRDPSSYAGVGWCFGLHDRPFPERPIWGKIRPMTPRGLERKFDLEAYIARIASLQKE